MESPAKQLVSRIARWARISTGQNAAASPIAAVASKDFQARNPRSSQLLSLRCGSDSALTAAWHLCRLRRAARPRGNLGRLAGRRGSEKATLIVLDFPLLGQCDDRADRIRWNRYDRYLKSPDWQLPRAACLRRDGYRCRRCSLQQGSLRNPLHAGHLSYRITMRPQAVSDRQMFCRECHEITPGRQFRQRTFSPWLGRWWQRQPFRPKAVLVWWGGADWSWP
jgi:hypothetical protein